MSTTNINGQTKKDTTFLLQEFLSDGAYHVVFVENNPNSNYYKMIQLPKIDFSEYKGNLKKITDSFSVPIKKHLLYNIAKEWYPLKLYKNKYYLYIPSDPGINPWVKINDSSINELYFDPGIVTSIIKNTERIDSNTIQLTVANLTVGQVSFKVHVININKGLAIFERPYSSPEYKYTLMIEKSKIKNYPIIVNYCNESRVDEWKFDNPDFLTLLRKK